MAKNLTHESATRDAIATAVRSDLHAGTGANVNIKFYSETPSAQSTVVLDIDLGATPFGAASSAAITYTGTATGTKTSAGTASVQSFAIFDKATTPVKVIKGTVGATTTNWDIGITGGTSIKQNEKISLTNFVYTASV